MPTLIDPETDDIRPAREVIFARLGKRVSDTTLRRWRLDGVNGVRLECIRVGGCWCTTIAAFAEFLREQTRRASEPKRVSAVVRTRARKPRRGLEATHAE